MRILRRIVKWRTLANRTPLGGMAVPISPDLSQYANIVAGDKSDYEALLKCQKEELPVAVCHDEHPMDACGFLITYNRRIVAIPVKHLHGFMVANGITHTVTSPIDVYAELKSNYVEITGNMPDSQYDDSLLYVYDVSEEREEVRVPLHDSFTICKEGKEFQITPKGVITLPKLQVVEEPLLDVLNGSVLDVSWYERYRQLCT